MNKENKLKTLKEFSDRLKDEMNNIILRYSYSKLYGKMSEAMDKIKKEMGEEDE